MPRGVTPRSGRVPTFDGHLTVLSREGRQHPAPDWPLPGEASPREALLWEQEWTRPQAVIWQQDRLENDVALYVRKRAEAEAPGSSSASVDTMRRLLDDLLLTIPAMRRAGVVIGEDPASPGSAGHSVRHAPDPSRSSGSPRSARERFRVVQPDSGWQATPNDTDKDPA